MPRFATKIFYLHAHVDKLSPPPPKKKKREKFEVLLDTQHDVAMCYCAVTILVCGLATGKKN